MVLVLAALGAVGIAVGSLVSLLVSEYTPLFGFMESGYRLAVVLTLIFDGLTAAFLGVFILTIAAARRQRPPAVSQPRPRPSHRRHRGRRSPAKAH